MLSVVIAATWMNMGSATLIYLAALQSIPGELYEAAELDGAGLWRRIWHVTIPQTRLILSLMLLLQIIATMQEFTEVYLLTGGDGPQGTHDDRGLPDVPVRLQLQQLRQRGGARRHHAARADRLHRVVRAAEPSAGTRAGRR